MRTSASHILVVDDEPSIREGLALAFKHIYVVHAAATGAEACAILRRHPIAAIVLDAMLGLESGLDLIIQFRAFSPARIVILTGHSSEELAIRAVREDADDYLKKPVGLPELQASLKRLIPEAESPPDWIAWAREQLLNSLDQPHTAASLARKLGMSDRQLRRRFTEVYGHTPRRLLTELRLNRAAQLLRRTGLGIKEVAHSVGFPTLRAFERAFKCAFRVTPSVYREMESEVFLPDREP